MFLHTRGVRSHFCGQPKCADFVVLAHGLRELLVFFQRLQQACMILLCGALQDGQQMFLRASLHCWQVFCWPGLAQAQICPGSSWSGRRTVFWSAFQVSQAPGGRDQVPPPPPVETLEQHPLVEHLSLLHTSAPAVLEIFPDATTKPDVTTEQVA